MASSLTAVGVVWALLSLVAAVTNCVAFYLPFWIQVRYHFRVSRLPFAKRAAQ